MPGIVDVFAVELGLDPSKVRAGAKAVRAEIKSVREDTVATGKDIDSSTKRMAEGFTTVRNQLTSLLLVFAGASGVKSFVSTLGENDAAVGRFAKNMGVATEQVSAWEGVMKRVGGNAGDARSALSTLFEAQQSFALTGTTGKDMDFLGLGISRQDIQSLDPGQLLLKLADARQRMGQAEFTARATRLGLTDSTITLLSRGRAGLEDMLAEQRKLGVATQESSEAWQRLDDRLARIQARIEDGARPVLERLIDAFEKLDDKIGLANLALPVAAGLLAATGFAAAAAIGPIGLLAVAVAALTARYVDLSKAGAAWQILGLRADKFYAESQALALRRSNPQKSGEYLQRAADDAGLILMLTEGANSAPSGGGGAINSSPAATSVGPSVRRDGKGGTDPEIYNFFKARYGAQRAAGITAGIKAEGGSLGMAANGAFGLGQWRGPRLKALFARYGRSPTKAQQLAFLAWELEGGDRGGKSVLAQTTAADTLSHYIGGDSWGFMRPGAGRAGDMARGMAALGYAGSVRPRGGAGGGVVNGPQTNIGTINVYTAATDAKGIARDLPGAIRQRGIAVQAGGGLR